jgi:hypothetical protein
MGGVSCVRLKSWFLFGLKQWFGRDALLLVPTAWLKICQAVSDVVHNDQDVYVCIE